MTTRTSGIQHGLRGAVARCDAGDRSDAQFLDRFIRAGDEAAFELLVWRHRRLVLGVCRRILGDYHDAEDAFQATFLTLARKAESIGRRESLAPWLYQVAYRTALTARSRLRPATAADLTAVPSPADHTQEADLRDLGAALDDEVNRLPAGYRAAVVLCYLQGKTYREAGAELGLPLGTVSAHLTRARELLRDALARRGVAVPATALVGALCGHATAAGKSASLVDRTVQIALSGPEGWGATAGLASSRAAVLSKGVLKTMALTKLKAAAVVSAGVLLAAVAVGAVVYYGTGQVPHPDQPQVGAPPAPTIAERFQAIKAACQADGDRWNAQLRAAKTAADKEAVAPLEDEAYATKLWALVEEAPKDPSVLDICCWIAVYHCWSAEAPKALAVLRRDHLTDPRLGPLCPVFVGSPDASAEAFLRAVQAGHPDPVVRDRAALALATHLSGHVLWNHARTRRAEIPDPPPTLRRKWTPERLPLGPDEEVRLTEEVEAICQDTIARRSDMPWVPHDPEGEAAATMGKQARAVLDLIEEVDVRRLAPGRPAPEITAADSEGKSLKLSDFRGKVVLLSFGGQGCAPCRAMIPHERELVKRLAGRPFTLVGFDRGTDEQDDSLKAFLARHEVTWRVCSVRSSGSGGVFRGWNVQAIPVLFLVDDQGVIRQRFDGYTEGQVLDAAVDALVREAEERAGPPKAK